MTKTPELDVASETHKLLPILTAWETGIGLNTLIDPAINTMLTNLLTKFKIFLVTSTLHRQTVNSRHCRLRVIENYCVNTGTSVVT